MEEPVAAVRVRARAVHGKNRVGFPVDVARVEELKERVPRETAAAQVPLYVVEIPEAGREFDVCGIV